MSEYEALRNEIERMGTSYVNYAAAVDRYAEVVNEQFASVWQDNAELRDELHALANRVETLTRARLTEPAETAGAMVAREPFASDERLRFADGTVTCSMCGGSGALTVHQGGKPEQVKCARCEGFGRVRDEARSRS